MRLRGIALFRSRRSRSKRTCGSEEESSTMAFLTTILHEGKLSEQAGKDESTSMSALFWSPFSGTISLSAFSSLI